MRKNTFKFLVSKAKPFFKRKRSRQLKFSDQFKDFDDIRFRARFKVKINKGAGTVAGATLGGGALGYLAGQRKRKNEKKKKK